MYLGVQHGSSSRAVEQQILSYGSWKGWKDGRPLTTPGDLPQIWCGNEPNHTVTCMVLKATANDKRHLALCHNEFHGPRSGL
ncbi:hypothetical protein TNCV_1873081 [Trichonephila clavipes]|nr:hypothetical protein TNCV_1873081 [Trichonephila clavipes]